MTCKQRGPFAVGRCVWQVNHCKQFGEVPMDLAFHVFPNADGNPGVHLVACEIGVVGNRVHVNWLVVQAEATATMTMGR